jgi:hypothetical protein
MNSKTPYHTLLFALIFTFSVFTLPATEAQTMEYEIGETIYENPLSGPEDIAAWVIESGREGHPVITFPDGRMRLESDVHFLLWCPEEFPDNIAVSWDFQPRRDDGLAMFWIAARGRGGEDLFDSSLEERTGAYPQYHSGDIDALHVAYFRRNFHGEPLEERSFQTVHLRKSYGFHLAATAGDPIPSVRDVVGPYRIQVIKYGPHFRFSINDLVVLDWYDDGGETGPVLKGGKIGFRQMAGLIADYGNLRVNRVTPIAE